MALGPGFCGPLLLLLAAAIATVGALVADVEPPDPVAVMVLVSVCPRRPQLACGRDERSESPTVPSVRKCASHFLAVPGQRSAAHAVSGVRPLSIDRTRRSRPIGVERAFLWMFIRSPREV